MDEEYDYYNLKCLRLEEAIVNLRDELANYQFEIDMLNHRIVELERELS